MQYSAPRPNLFPGFRKASRGNSEQGDTQESNGHRLIKGYLRTFTDWTTYFSAALTSFPQLMDGHEQPTQFLEKDSCIWTKHKNNNSKKNSRVYRCRFFKNNNNKVCFAFESLIILSADVCLFIKFIKKTPMCSDYAIVNQVVKNHPCVYSFCISSDGVGTIHTSVNSGDNSHFSKQ